MIEDVLLIEPRWERTLRVSRVWMTSLQLAISGGEKRSQLLYRPNLGTSYQVLAENVQEVMALKGRLQRFGHMRLGIPVWPWRSELSTGIAAGATILPVVSTAYMNIEAGCYILIYQDAETAEYFEVASVAAAAIGLRTSGDHPGPTTLAWPVGTSVYYLLPALASSSGKGFRMLTDMAAEVQIGGDAYWSGWPEMDFPYTPPTTTTVTVTTSSSSSSSSSSTSETLPGQTTTTTTAPPAGPAVLDGMYAQAGADQPPHTSEELTVGAAALVDGDKMSAAVSFDQYGSSVWPLYGAVGIDLGVAIKLKRLEVYGPLFYLEQYEYGPPATVGFTGSVAVFRSENNLNWVFVGSFVSPQMHYNAGWYATVGMRLVLPDSAPAARFWKAVCTSTPGVEELLQVDLGNGKYAWFQPMEVEAYTPAGTKITDGYEG